MSSETREIMHDQHSHPVNATRTYGIIGVVLLLVTGLEIYAYVIEETLGAAATPVILGLSAVKFFLVVAFYMHLKYDSKLFTGIFLFPFALATLVIGGLTILYHVLHPLR
jgi:cytochrome c oxidase subunit IV